VFKGKGRNLGEAPDIIEATMTDRWSEVIGSCPCGKGSVVEHLTESDHPWIANHSRTSTTDLECDTCSKEWRYSGSEFIQIASERELERIRREQAELQSELQAIAAEVVAAFLENKVYPSMNAEWKELKTFELFSESLVTYRRRRRGSRSIVSLLSPRWGIPWIAANLSVTQKGRATAISKRLDNLQGEEKEAARLVVRVPFVPAAKA
jgi:hypothetical protein